MGLDYAERQRQIDALIAARLARGPVLGERALVVRDELGLVVETIKLPAFQADLDRMADLPGASEEIRALKSPPLRDWSLGPTLEEVERAVETVLTIDDELQVTGLAAGFKAEALPFGVALDDAEASGVAALALMARSHGRSLNPRAFAGLGEKVPSLSPSPRKLALLKRAGA